MRLALIAVATGASAGCGSGDGISTAEAEAAAEAQVRERFGLGADAALATQVFVGAEWRGEPVLCGTVAAAGSEASFPPQRFVASTDPARWLVFEGAHDPMRSVEPDKFAEWLTHCQSEEGDAASEPLAPTEIGEN